MSKTTALPWFKMPPYIVLHPKFQKMTIAAQAGYMTLCSTYWQDEGVMTVEDAEDLCDEVGELILKGYVVETADRHLDIEFLREQLEEQGRVREKRVEAGRKGGKAKAKQVLSKSQASAKQTASKVQAEKIREDKKEIREKEIDRKIDRENETRVNEYSLEKEFLEVEEVETFDQEPEIQKEKVMAKTKRFEPPTETQVQLFFQTTESPHSWEGYFNYYLANGWRVGQNPMMDWQAAARNWLSREKEFVKNKPQYNGKRQPVTGQILNNLEKWASDPNTGFD